MNIDTLFRDKEYNGHFRFDQDTVTVFEDMLSRSVPLYPVIQDMILSLTMHFLKPDSKICDLGCSKGHLCRKLRRAVDKTDVRIIGIDNSPDMINSAITLTDNYENGGIEFICQDITKTDFSGASVVISCLTLQFIDPEKRSKLIGKVYESLLPGGAMIVFEKTENENEMIRELEIDSYYDLKRQNGYSEDEIIKKKKALEGILIPLSDERNLELLKAAGFKNVSLIFKWMNFSGYIAIK